MTEIIIRFCAWRLHIVHGLKAHMNAKGKLEDVSLISLELFCIHNYNDKGETKEHSYNENTSKKRNTAHGKDH